MHAVFPALLPCTVRTSIGSASKLNTLRKDAVCCMVPRMRTVARNSRPGLGSSTLSTAGSSSSLVHTFSLSPWTDVAFQLGYCFCVCLDYVRGPIKPVFRRQQFCGGRWRCTGKIALTSGNQNWDVKDCFKFLELWAAIPSSETR